MDSSTAERKNSNSSKDLKEYEKYVMNLSGMFLPDVPSPSQWTHLRYVFLNHNNLVSIPETVSEMKNLEGLFLAYNQLTYLPSSIGQLSALSILSLSSNNLRSLPESIVELRRLSLLYLAHNQLTHLPESFGNIKSLRCLQLDNNHITSLPSSLRQLDELDTITFSENKSLVGISHQGRLVPVPLQTLLENSNEKFIPFLRSLNYVMKRKSIINQTLPTGLEESLRQKKKRTDDLSQVSSLQSETWISPGGYSNTSIPIGTTSTFASEHSTPPSIPILPPLTQYAHIPTHSQALKFESSMEHLPTSSNSSQEHSTEYAIN